MNSANNRKLFIYSSLFITLALNIPRLLALRKDGLIARFWHFNLNELICQTVFNFLFCLVVFYYNRNRFHTFFRKWSLQKQGLYLLVNILILLAFIIAGFILQRLFFSPRFLPDGGNSFRLIVSMVLMMIELRIAVLLQESRSREMENEHLRNAYLKSELEVLKAQLNPHFFFNALSSLSAVVRENPPKAQYYINHLSKTFRYSLQTADDNMISLKEEINAVISYSELLKMRHEDGFELKIDIDEHNTGFQIPHMSLQPLVENALKHNIASSSRPLRIEISTRDHFLTVKNNLQPVSFPEPGVGIGLANLNERFRILMQREIEIVKTPDAFIVNLPLK